MQKTILGLLLAVSLLLLAQSPRAASEEGFTKFDRIAGAVADAMRTYEVPGVSVAVFTNFQIEWAKGFGIASVATRQPVDAQTLFQAASISKPVAAAAALRLVQDGKLDLDKPINTYLTSWKLPPSDLAKDTPVTLRRILSHTAGVSVHGFKGYESSEKVPTLLQVLDGQKPANSDPIRVTIPPGTKFEYSGGAYTIMQQAMIDVTKQPFPELLRALVLDPAGMHFSTYEQPLPDRLVKFATAGHVEHGALLPGARNTYPEMAAAGLWTTPSDLARFGMEIQRARLGRSSAVLSKEMADLMATPEKGIASMKAPGGLENWYGHGFEVYNRNGKLFFGHTGGNEGYRCMLALIPATGNGVAVMTNGDVFEAVRQIVERIMAEYGW
jgi:CubicO group peptidase (beta-lactamase class C family)